MRIATTEQEKGAFLWFYEIFFLECVCSLKPFLGVQKSKQRVSQATRSATKHGKLVAISDDAFALLLYNYIEKWLKALRGTTVATDPSSTTTEDQREEQKSKKEREKGKYTAQKEATASIEGGATKEW